MGEVCITHVEMGNVIFGPEIPRYVGGN